LALIVLLQLINRFLALSGHLEIPPCSQVRTIAFHALQDFIATEVLRPDQVDVAILVTIVPEGLHLQPHPCSLALWEVSAPKAPIFLSRVPPELSTTKLNPEVFLNAYNARLVSIVKVPVYINHLAYVLPVFIASVVPQTQGPPTTLLAAFALRVLIVVRDPLHP